MRKVLGRGLFPISILWESQAECYLIILKEVEDSGTTCTPEEQAGQFWDDEKDIDTREHIERT